MEASYLCAVGGLPISAIVVALVVNAGMKIWHGEESRIS